MAKMKKPIESSILKGALAGVAGGLVGIGVKTLASRIYSPYLSQTQKAPLEAEAPAAGLHVQDVVKPWLIGAAAGAVYGAAMEIQPSAGVWGGAGFGLGLRKFTSSTFSATSAGASVRQSTQQRQSEWVSYALYGLVTEGVRKVLRKAL